MSTTTYQCSTFSSRIDVILSLFLEMGSKQECDLLHWVFVSHFNLPPHAMEPLTP